MSKEQLLKTLTDIGLKKTEAKIYLYLAKKGPKKANQITKAIGITKQRFYPIIKDLQNKAIINCSLDRPAKFTAIPFEKILDLFAKTKLEEAKIMQQNRGKLLSDWELINPPAPKGKFAFFTVIKGKKYVYSKIQQMVQETKSHFSVISNISDLFRAEQYGVLDVIQSHPRKYDIQVRIITEVPKNYLQAVKKLLRTINPQLKLKGRNSDLGLSPFPRMVIRDNEEILYFISTKASETKERDNEDALFTNCNSFVKPLSSVFENLWKSSTDIEQKIREMETGNLPKRTIIIKDLEEAKNKYNEVMKKAKREILIVASSDNLIDFQDTILKIKDSTKHNLSIKILSPIIKDNLKTAREMLNYSEVRHIPQGYLDTTIVDGIHLFQFNSSPSIINGIKTEQNFKNTFYTNDPEHIMKTRNMLENIWYNSTNPSNVPLDSVINPLDSFAIQSKSVSNDPSSEIIYDYLISKPVIERTVPSEVTEKEVISKILNQDQSSDSSKRSIKCYCKMGYAAINPPDHFNLPKLLISITQIDKKSSFGAEDRIVIHLWKETMDGSKYVPVAIIGDNPNFPVELLTKGQYRNTPAAKNFHLVKREEIQFQLYENTFLASWILPIRLSDKFTLPPGTIILEGYGEIKTKRVLLQYPAGTKYNIFYNAFDSFVTFLHKSSKYTGPGTDGLFLRDAFIEMFPPE